MNVDLRENTGHLVTVGTIITVVAPPNTRVNIKHTGYQNDARLASAVTDYIVVSVVGNASGNFADGPQIPIDGGDSQNVLTGPTGTLSIIAVGNAAKVLVTR